MVFWASQGINFKLNNRLLIRRWLNEIVRLKGQTLNALSVIFCSDSFLLDLNRKFLNHDYYTDVITFDARVPHHEQMISAKGIEGDIFISIDRVKDNANFYEVPFREELTRVMAHGLVHLLGYNDSTLEDRESMRREEDAALRLLAKMFST